jgi:hypothetical protein
MRQCPRCGAFVPDERQRCDCGHDLSTEAKEADASRTSTAPPPGDAALLAEPRAKSCPPLPRSVKVLGGFYLLMGGLALLGTIWAAFQGTFYLDIGVIGIPLGVGLLRRSPAWHKLALCAAVVQILGIGVMVYILYTYGEEYEDMWAGLSAKIGPLFG